jgi:hypothetical protein
MIETDEAAKQDDDNADDAGDGDGDVEAKSVDEYADYIESIDSLLDNYNYDSDY